MSPDYMWYNNLSKEHLEGLRKIAEAQDRQRERKFEVALDIHKLASLCCGCCRLKDHEIECDECIVYNIKKKYEGAEKCPKNPKKSK